MDMKQLYYIPPSDEIFDEVKQACIEVWRTQHGGEYAEEKVERIKDWENIQDNMMSMIDMFDNRNISHLSKLLSKDARCVICDRLIDGGVPEYITFFL